MPPKPYSSNMTSAIFSRFLSGFIGGSVRRILRPCVSTLSFSWNV